MSNQDLLLALLLPVPPWLGFLIYRLKGRIGLSYGYFLGGILAVLSLPWPQIGGRSLPSAHLGGALFGFTLFLQAHREGRNGLRRLAVGVGGATLFAWIIGTQMGLDMHSVVVFWVTALVEASFWLILSDLGYRLTKGRWLSIRVPAVGGAAFLIATGLHRVLPLGPAPFAWLASLLAGTLLGLVALQQLLWLRSQGIWVEGRGNGFRVALSALKSDQPPESPALTYVIEAQQPFLLVNEEGRLLESNTAFSRVVGLPRHQLRGYELQSLFQGKDQAVWEDLKEQLQRESSGSVAATLVRQDSSFLDVQLEAVAFDRNMALVWIAEETLGAVALRGPGASPALVDEGEAESTRGIINALGAIQPSAEAILSESQEPRTRELAELILTAIRRMVPPGLASQAVDLPAPLVASEILEAFLPRLQLMLPSRFRAAIRAEELHLQVDQAPFLRIATYLVLHGRQGLREGTVTLVLKEERLGSRRWCQLGLELSGPAAQQLRAPLGLEWLRLAVDECKGFLEVVQDARGRLWPRIHLPLSGEPAPLILDDLEGRTIWVLDQDPLVGSALAAILRQAGSEADTFVDLPGLMRGLRHGPVPDVLVLERSSKLERFQRLLRRISGRPIPALLMDSGRSIPALEPPVTTHRRLAFLRKPFSGQHFQQCLLALLTPLPGDTPE